MTAIFTERQVQGLELLIKAVLANALPGSDKSDAKRLSRVKQMLTDDQEESEGDKE